MLGAAFVRMSRSQHAKEFRAVAEVCGAMEQVAQQRPVLANDLRPRIGVENRLPEFIEEALRVQQFPRDLVEVLRRTARLLRNIWPTASSAACGGKNATVWWTW